MQPDFDVAIIGAGFGGLGAAIRLKQQGGHSFVVFERAAEVGGTWRDNTYPGCACDVPSHLYSFSFAPNPGWSRMYSPQPEILAYIKGCVERFGLGPHLRCNTDVVKAEFVASGGYWRVHDRAGHVTTARVVVGAIGPLNRPATPELPGFTQFAGPAFHSSEWRHDVDLTGKRVAVIGTGASAIQIVPEVAKRAGHLDVYQRTAPWITPRPDRALSAREQRLYQKLPVTQQLYRNFIYWMNELVGLSFLGNQTLRRLARWQATKHIETQIADPALRARVTPNYEIGCKRILVSDEYYPALQRPNVALVTERIAEITPTAILTADGQAHPTDVLIYSTGFVAADIVSYLDIIGRDGRKLFDEWAETGAQSLKGTATAGYPGLLLIMGPNTGLGHNSIIHIIESQVAYILDYLRHLKTLGPGQYLDVKPDVQAAYNHDVQQRLNTTVWASGCQSWYVNKSGRNTTIFPGLNTHFRKLTRRMDPADFNIVQMGRQETEAILQ